MRRDLEGGKCCCGLQRVQPQHSSGGTTFEALGLSITARLCASQKNMLQNSGNFASFQVVAVNSRSAAQLAVLLRQQPGQPHGNGLAPCILSSSAAVPTMCTNKKTDFSSSAVVPTMSTAKKLAFAATNWGHPNCAIRWRQIWATFQKDKRQKWTLQNPFIPDWTFFFTFAQNSNSSSTHQRFASQSHPRLG